MLRTAPTFLSLFCLVIFSACNRTNQPAPTPTKETPTAANPAGIDVSHFDHDVDWHAVNKGGHAFAYAKATEGVDFRDPEFTDNWEGMKQVNLMRGAYHFYVARDDPKQQAEWFIQNVQLEPGDLPPALDIETLGTGSSHNLINNLQTWLQTVEAHYGVKPILYTDQHFANAYDLGEAIGDYPLWIAEYETESPTLPIGWSTYLFWQYTQSGDVPGVTTKVDLNKVNGGHEVLHQIKLR